MIKPSESSTKPRISVVLPVYQTAGFLRELYERSVASLSPIASDFELLMVDDGSRDEAWTIIEDLASKDARVKGIRFSRNFGQHPAIAAAFEHATGNVVVLMDTDLQDRPEDIPLLVEKLVDPIDIAYSLKQGEPERGLVRFTSHIYHYTFSRLTGTNVPRDIGTFRAFTRPVLEAALTYPEKSILYGPLMFHMGFQSTLVPVRHERRPAGRSAYSFRRRLFLAVDSLISYTDLPHRILMSFGALILIACGVYTAVLVIKYVVSRGSLPPGLTLLALLITASLGSVTLSLGILGSYIFRVYQEVLRRPRYIISRSRNLAS